MPEMFLFCWTKKGTLFATKAALLLILLILPNAALSFSNLILCYGELNSLIIIRIIVHLQVFSLWSFTYEYPTNNESHFFFFFFFDRYALGEYKPGLCETLAARNSWFSQGSKCTCVSINEIHTHTSLAACKYGHLSFFFFFHEQQHLASSSSRYWVFFFHEYI